MKFPLPKMIVIIPLLELGVFFLAGELVGWARALSLVFGFSMAGVILLMLRFGRKTPLGAAGGVPAGLDPLLFRFGAVLLVFPGYLTSVLGIFLLFPLTRGLLYGWFVRRYFPNGFDRLPPFWRLLAQMSGINLNESYAQKNGGYGTGHSSRTSSCAGPTEYSDCEVFEETDLDTKNAYNGDITHPAPVRESGGEDDIIDVDYTVR